MLKVYYTEKQAIDAGSFSPSAIKPKIVIESWIAEGLPVEILKSWPLETGDFCLAHDPMYVKGIFDLSIPNGFGNTKKDVADTFQYTSGSMYSAARKALSDYSGVACSPTSGFHHASFGGGGGFCTFNGLVIAAQKLKSEKKLSKAGILDLDNHYGNGTDNIIKKLGLKYISHFTAGASYSSPRQSEIFLSTLESVIRKTFVGCDLVMYQAGADVHIDDPLGGWLTTEQIIQRDRIVFETLKDMRIACAWNFAGGYQKEADGSIPKVIEIHTNTLRECVSVYGLDKAKESESVA